MSKTYVNRVGENIKGNRSMMSIIVLLEVPIKKVVAVKKALTSKDSEIIIARPKSCRSFQNKSKI